MIIFRYLYKITALLFLVKGATLLLAQDPESGPPADELHIDVVVGMPFDFPLDAPNDVSDLSLDGLPDGLVFDAEGRKIVGTASTVGDSTAQLTFSQGGVSDTIPIFFHVHPEGTVIEPPHNPDEGPLWIVGTVGEQLNFPLPYDPQSAEVDFGQNADGTASVLPEGLQLDAQNGSIVGVPQQPGQTDFTLIIVEDGETRHKAIVFEIHPEGTLPEPPDGPNDGPIKIDGFVGQPLEFWLPIGSNVTEIFLEVGPDGVASQLPLGLEIEFDTGRIIGVPSDAGIYETHLIIVEGENELRKTLLFDIYNDDPSNHGPHPINIVGAVGQEMQFQLPIPTELTELQFGELPEGLEFDTGSLSIVGIPLFPGFFESGITAIKDGESIWLPVFFDIFGDSFPGDGPHHDEIKIHGFVGEFISFPLPFSPDLSEVSLTLYADGTQSELPIGIELDTLNGLIIGFPQEPGFFEASLTISEGEESHDLPIFFDIQYTHFPGGDPTDPPYQDEFEDEDIYLFGEVGTRFSFRFPTDGNETIELPSLYEDAEYALPPGLEYNADINAITGAPTESGLFEVLVLVSKPDFEDKKTLRFLVSDSGDAPRLSFFSESEFRIGQPFSFPILASGSPSNYEVIEGLPEGVEVDAQTGLVSGLLDIDEDFDLIVKVSNNAGDAYGIHFLDVNFPRPDDHPPEGGVDHVEETEPFPGRVGVPFRLQAPDEFANATMTLVAGESFPAGIGFDLDENAVISGTPTEAGLFKTRISIENEGKIEDVILTFFIFDDAGAPQFVSGDYLRVRPGDVIELPLIIANGPADISIETDRPGISLDTTSNTLRGAISEPGFYTVLAKAENESGSTIHLIDIDVFDDGTQPNPGDHPTEPIRVWAIVGEPLDFALPADPFKSVIVFVDSDSGTPSVLPQGLEYIGDYALIKGVPEQEGMTDLFIEITEFGFTRREHIIFEIYLPDNLPDDHFPGDPGHEEPDDGHVEPIVGKVGERLYFEAPIEGDNILFELVPGPDGSESELAPGITFDDQAGILSGVPTKSGIFPIWVKVDDNGHVRTHFAPLLISGPEGSPVITSDEFFSLMPGEHFEFQVKAENEPTNTFVEFFDVPGILSYDADSMVLNGKFEFGGFFTLLIVAENEVGTGYGLLNVDVLGFNNDPNGEGNFPAADIPLQINGVASEKIDFELPSYVRGSSFVVTEDPTGIAYSIPLGELPDGLELDPKTGRVSGTPEYPGFYFVHVTVDGGELPSLALNIGIVETLPLPQIVSPDWTFGSEDAPFHYNIYATNHPFEFFATNLPAGLTLDPASGAISGVPVGAGEFEVQLSASNSTGTGEMRALVIRIGENKRLPVVHAPYFREGLVGETFELLVRSTENPDAFHAFGLPRGLSINIETGLISGTPEEDGFFEVKLEAHNEWGVGVFHTSILIKRAVLAPIYVGPRDLAGKVGQPFFFNPRIEGGATEFSISENSPISLPEGLSIDSETGLISGTPSQTISGTIELLVRGEGGSVIVPINLKIVPAFDAPVITSSSFAKATSGQLFEYRIIAQNSPVEFRVDNLPEGLSVDTISGLISGTPLKAGYLDLVMQARNVEGWGPPRLLILDITPAFDTPIIVSAPYAKAKVGEPFEYQTLASNSPSAYLAVGDLPEGLSFDSDTGLLSGVPTEAGVRNLVLAASNLSGVGNGMLFTISIQPSEAMPKIVSSGTAFGKVNEPFNFRIEATGNPTSYAVENLPDGLSLDEVTGVVSGKPVRASEEPIVLVLYASNSAGRSLPRAVILEIAPADAAPSIISGGHAIGKAGEEFRFQVFATNDPTSYFSRNLPQGLSIDSETGVIAGIPEAAGEFKVMLQASNAVGSGDPASLALFILPAAETPQITSAPYARGKVGEEFEYQIEASSDEIDSYQVRGDLPRGIDFDPVTGLISGSPVEPGISFIELTVTNAAGTSMPQSLTIKIAPSLEAPVIISSLHVRGRVGLEFNYEIQATNMPEARPLPQGSEFDAIGLPQGLGINQSSGVIAGIPEEAGHFKVVLVATNASGQGNRKTLVFEIAPALDAPQILSTSKVSAQVGVSFNYQILASGTPSSYDVDHSISWLKVDTSTGYLSGTPDKPGVFYAEMVAENDSGQSEFKPLHIVVFPAMNTPKIISNREAVAQVGTEFSYQIEATESPTGFAVSGLPSGLSLDAETGEISGTPKASGTFEIVVAASNANGLGNKAILFLKIKPRNELKFVVTDNNS